MGRIVILILFSIFFPTNSYSIEDKFGKCVMSSSFSENIKRLEGSVSLAKRGELYEIREILSDEEGAASLNSTDEEVLCALNDKGIDWRIRYYLLSTMSIKGINNKYSGDILRIAADKNEREEIRSVAVMMLIDIYKEDKEVKVGLNEIARSSETPSKVLRSVMSVIGESGTDDADAIMEKVYYPGKSMNDLGINLNGVSALGKSKDPRAFGYLIKIYDESRINSFFHVTAIETMWYFVKDSERREMVRPVIVPRLLKLMDDRSYGGPSRREAAEILGYLQVKEAAEPIKRWFLPRVDLAKELAECRRKLSEGNKPIDNNKYMECWDELNKLIRDPYKSGGNRMDIISGSRVLTQLGDKSAIAVLEKFLENYGNDIRSGSLEWRKEFIKNGGKFPDDIDDYQYVKNCLKALKGGKVIRDLYDDDGIERDKWLKSIYGGKK